MRCLVISIALIAMLTTTLLPAALAQEGPLPVVHTVQPGETLFRIALRYGVTVDALKVANGLSETSVLLSGQALIIPTAAVAAARPMAGRTHRVAQGESLEQIARRYNVTTDALLRANNLTALTPLQAGQVLIIPAGSGAADLGLMGVSVPIQPASPPIADLGILPAGAAPSPANVAPHTASTSLQPDPPEVNQPPAAEEVSPVNTMPLAPEAPLAASAGLQPNPPEADQLPAALEASPANAAPLAPVQEELALVTGTFDATLIAPDLGILDPPATFAQASESAPEAAESGELPASQPLDNEVVLSASEGIPDVPDLGIIPPETALWVRQPGLFTTGGPRVREIYERGQALGNNPRAFSKVGDCNSQWPFFLARFDSGEYDLGPYQYLQPVIDYFAGSFGRKSVAVWTGNHAWSVLDPTFADPTLCLAGETPLACEFRLHRPSVVLIRLGTNEANTPALFEQYLRSILDYAIERGVIPILGTKADQLEGSDAINEIVRQLAAEYQVPLWDFGRIASTLPGRGLSGDGYHMTWYPLTYSDPRALQQGHSVHNLTALIALYTVWQNVLR